MEVARAAQQTLDTHARRLDAAQRTWRQVVASLGDPTGGDAPPQAAVDAEQLVNHVVKLLYHLVASSGRLTPELSGRLTACVVRMLEQATECGGRLDAAGDGRGRLMRHVGQWCTWALTETLRPRLGAEEGAAPGGEAEAEAEAESRELLSHFAVGTLDWAGAVAAEGARALAQHLSRLDAPALAAVAAEGLPAVRHPLALPAIQELVSHACRAAQAQQEGGASSEGVAAILPPAFCEALLASSPPPRPFDSFRTRTKLEWWRLHPADFDKEVLDLAQCCCASFPYSLCGPCAAQAKAAESVPLLAQGSRRIAAIAECGAAWPPILDRAVDLLLQLVCDTAHPALPRLLDALLEAATECEQEPLRGGFLASPASPGVYAAPRSHEQATVAPGVDALAAMNKARREMLEGQQDGQCSQAGEQAAAAQQAFGVCTWQHIALQRQQTGYACACSLAFVRHRQPGRCAALAWSTAGQLAQGLPSEGSAHAAAMCAVEWLGWYLAPAVEAGATQATAEADTAALVRRTVLADPGDGTMEQGSPAAAAGHRYATIRAYSWLAAARHTRTEGGSVKLAAVVEALAQPESEGCEVLSAAAFLDLSHQWAEECEAGAAFPDGFWAAVVQHLQKRWLEAGPLQGSEPSARGQSARCLL
eukprot:COSAG04_NODE_2145_length_4698_cov_2.402479_1_plen_647_part_10